MEKLWMVAWFLVNGIFLNACDGNEPRYWVNSDALMQAELDAVPQEIRGKEEATKRLIGCLKKNPYNIEMVKMLVGLGIIPDTAEYCEYTDCMLLQTFEDALRDPKYQDKDFPWETLVILLDAGCDEHFRFEDQKTHKPRLSLREVAQEGKHPKARVMHATIEIWKREKNEREYQEDRKQANEAFNISMKKQAAIMAEQVRVYREREKREESAKAESVRLSAADQAEEWRRDRSFDRVV